jgi:hypothetical protein
MRLKNRGRDKLKISILGVKNDQKCRKSRHEKNRRFVIFWVTFLSILSENCPIRIYRKTGPTKSTVLGPRPPPWEKYKFYRILSIFRDFGVFNTAGKSVTKIGIYSKPPPKSRFYTVFINSRPNFNARAQFITTSPFNDHHWKVPGATFWTFELRQFFWECFVFLFLWIWRQPTKRKQTLLQKNERSQGRSLTKRRRERGRGRLTRRKQQYQAIVHYPISPIYHNLSPDVPKGADKFIATQLIRRNIGPRYSLSTLTIGNTYVCFYLITTQYHDRF